MQALLHFIQLCQLTPIDIVGVEPGRRLHSGEVIAAKCALVRSSMYGGPSGRETDLDRRGAEYAHLRG